MAGIGTPAGSGIVSTSFNPNKAEHETKIRPLHVAKAKKVLNSKHAGHGRGVKKVKPLARLKPATHGRGHHAGKRKRR